MFTPLLTYVSRWFERRRGSAVALISSGQSVAGALWPTLITVSVDGIGWRHTMMFYGVFLTLAVVALAVLFLRAPPVAAAQPTIVVPSTASARCQRAITACGSATPCSIMFAQTSSAPPGGNSASAWTCGARAPPQRRGDHHGDAAGAGASKRWMWSWTSVPALPPSISFE